MRPVHCWELLPRGLIGPHTMPGGVLLPLSRDVLPEEVLNNWGVCRGINGRGGLQPVLGPPPGGVGPLQVRCWKGSHKLGGPKQATVHKHVPSVPVLPKGGTGGWDPMPTGILLPIHRDDGANTLPKRYLLPAGGKVCVPNPAFFAHVCTQSFQLCLGMPCVPQLRSTPWVCVPNPPSFALACCVCPMHKSSRHAYPRMPYRDMCVCTPCTNPRTQASIFCTCV